MDALPADRQEDMPAELKLLRRENEVLHHDRETVKRATTIFVNGGVDEVLIH